MKKVIVTTTINPPTKAIEKFDKLEGWNLIVVGDLKTPKGYSLKKGLYVAPAMQEEYDKELSDAIGWNCIERRNFGFLIAHDMKADIVAVIDDDNIPYDGWGDNLLIGKEIETNYYHTDLEVFDPVGATNEKILWHRGYPLELLARRDYSNCTKKIIIPDIQADFWNGDPDIDAICRLMYMPECKFDEKCFPISSNKPAPFNSQNTFIKGTLLKDYFLFPRIGRMHDIWAAYYVQTKGAKVVFGRPSVYQERNAHNYINDMKQEYLGYENNYDLIKDIAIDPERIFKYLPDDSMKVLSLYKKHFNERMPI